jgi:hypothetical protein
MIVWLIKKTGVPKNLANISAFFANQSSPNADDKC